MYPLTTYDAVLRDHARRTVEREHDLLVERWRLERQRHVARRWRRR